MTSIVYNFIHGTHTSGVPLVSVGQLCIKGEHPWACPTSGRANHSLPQFLPQSILYCVESSHVTLLVALLAGIFPVYTPGGYTWKIPIAEKYNWGEPERPPHLSNGVPRDLCIYISMYLCIYISYVIP